MHICKTDVTNNTALSIYENKIYGNSNNLAMQL